MKTNQSHFFQLALYERIGNTYVKREYYCTHGWDNLIPSTT